MTGEEPQPVADASVGLSLPTKIFLGFSVVLGLFASVLVYNVAQLGRLYDEVTLVNRELVPLRLSLSEIQSDLRGYGVLLSEPDPVVLRRAVGTSQALFPVPLRVAEQLDVCVRAIDALEAQDLALGVDDPFGAVRTTLVDLRARNRRLSERSEALSTTLEAGDGDAGVEVLRRDLDDILAQMQSETALLSRQMGAVTAQALGQAADQQRRNMVVVAVSTAAALLVALLVMFWSARTLRPLTQLTEGVKRLRGGDYPTVEVEGRNEIGVLAQEFNQMVRALEQRDEALEVAHIAAIDSERLVAIGRMTSQITHEIRNPLSSIALNIELLQEELESGGPVGEEAVGSLSNITREIDQLTGITEEYLQFARLPRPSRQSQDLNELVRQLLDFHGHEMRQADVDVKLSLADGLPTIAVDQAQIRQALLNLVRNAREAMTGGGQLSVSTRREGDWVVLEVADQGSGIGAQARERMFTPFFSTKTRGTGLGLPMTRQIVTQHGGTIECLSEPGEGTRFMISIPVQDG